MKISAVLNINEHTWRGCSHVRCVESRWLATVGRFDANSFYGIYHQEDENNSTDWQSDWPYSSSFRDSHDNTSTSYLVRTAKIYILNQPKLGLTWDLSSAFSHHSCVTLQNIFHFTKSVFIKPNLLTELTKECVHSDILFLSASSSVELKCSIFK